MASFFSCCFFREIYWLEKRTLKEMRVIMMTTVMMDEIWFCIFTVRFYKKGVIMSSYRIVKRGGVEAKKKNERR